jgi:hypothetical protein
MMVAGMLALRITGVVDASTTGGPSESSRAALAADAPASPTDTVAIRA